ncbi:MAG TPA: hypothetical protein VG963_03595, partial [Polyangiaceae bacterium]|nr:hypothetical protein [Polyangiaceae bacterium]
PPAAAAGGADQPKEEMRLLPAVIAAQRRALEDEYENRRRERQGSDRTDDRRGPHQPGRRPRHSNPSKQVKELLEGAIYPTTRAPDYVVDQLGYGELVDEQREEGRNAIPRTVRRTRSGILVVKESKEALESEKPAPLESLVVGRQE